MPATGPTRDRAHLARAVAVAERARGVSSPNPAVGCVLVRDDRIVGEAATSVVGGPHAEVNALIRAGELARGATAYVTLEPCGHHGRTPPCAIALGDAGVRRVVFSLADPNPDATGGAGVLRRAGIDVEGGLYADWVARQLEGFVTAATAGRPHVTLKLAHTLDARLGSGPASETDLPTGSGPAAEADLPTRSGPASETDLPTGSGPASQGTAGDAARHAGRRWVTGTAARTAVHRWRAAVDAVLVGSGTVLADDPRLDVRHVPVRHGQPRAVVFDTDLRTPATANLARPGTLLLTKPDPDPGRARALEARGAEVHPVALGADGHLDVGAALSRLVELGVTSVLAEPGATLGNALVAAGAVDRLVSHVALGVGDGPLCLPVGDPPGGSWAVERLGGAGRDLILHLVPRPTRAPARDEGP